MSIATEITRLQNAKAALKTSINSKGGTITTEELDEYAAFVDAISTGSSYGDAIAADLLAGKTALSGGTQITGTMPNRGEVDSDITTKAQVVTIAAGYHNGSGTVQISAAEQAKVIAANIKHNISILGETGTYDTEASNPISAALVLAGKIGFVNGVKITGNIASKTAQTYTPSTSNQTIASGQYLSADQTILGDADLTAANIKLGVNIFGVVGTKRTLTTLATGVSISAMELDTSPVTYDFSTALGGWVGKTILLDWVSTAVGASSSTFKIFNQTLTSNSSGKIIAYVVSSTAVLITGTTSNAATTTSIAFTGLTGGDYVDLTWNVYEVV